jgi:RNA polymerase sigma factor (sigma-70 family)
MNASFPTRRGGGAPAATSIADRYEVISRAARAVARGRLGASAPALVDDAVAETLARAVERWDRLADHENLAGWAASCAHLVCLELLRRQRREATACWALVPGTSGDDGATYVVRDELARALALLSPRQRAVLTLRYLEDLDEVTTAARLGLSVANVRAAAHEGRTRLRHVLAA